MSGDVACLDPHERAIRARLHLNTKKRPCNERQGSTVGELMDRPMAKVVVKIPGSEEYPLQRPNSLDLFR
jgi:hypothetical protein